MAPFIVDTFQADRRLQQRLKQVAFGKSTVGYQCYTEQVPHGMRDPDNPDHPTTPRIDYPCSKRMWDRGLRQWRRSLHRWDPPFVEEDTTAHEL